jgi:Zn-dependent peptidase ImmA (M78 family)
MNRNGKVVELAHINPAVLRWAIKRSGLENDYIANKLKVDTNELVAWSETDGRHPQFDKAYDLAKILHIPFGFFFLRTPPSADLPLPDFRGFNRKYKPSPDLLELLNDILVKQDWYREYVAESSTKALDFVGRFSTTDSIFDVASAIRLRLGISQRLRQSVSSWTEYLATLTRQTEEQGVLVMRSGVVANITKRKLKVEELQGFALSDRFAPIVFVNSSDYKASQVFTVAHELAHLWIGSTALANADELGGGYNETETFCNKVAAEVLVPSEEFLNAWRNSSGESQTRVTHIARQFWVSSLVSVRRAHELGKISEDEFEKIKTHELAQRRKNSATGGDYYRNVIARMSARFTNAVLGDVNSGKLPLRDAARLLRMKVPTLVRFAGAWK